MAHTKSTTRGSDTSGNRCTSQRPDAPASGGSVEYADLFGTPAIQEDDSTPEEDPSVPEEDPERETTEYSDLFGTPALESDPGTSADTHERAGSQDRPPEPPNGEPVGDPSRARDPFASNRGDPPAAPSLPFAAQPAEKALYHEAYRAAYKYPHALQLVMSGVRKGLKRGKEAARREANQSP